MNYLLVGEMHGTNECPQAFFDLLQHYNISTVALELPVSKQAEIDRYLSDETALENLSFFKDKASSHDGRASEAMKSLVSRLKSEEYGIHLVDGEPADPLKRDQEMADNLKKIPGPVAFLCGNIHASKVPVRLPRAYLWGNKLANLFGKGVSVPISGMIQTCGSLLPNDETMSIKLISIQGGTFYNFQVKTMKPDHRFDGYSVSPILVPSYEHGFDKYYLMQRFTSSR